MNAFTLANDIMFLPGFVFWFLDESTEQVDAFSGPGSAVGPLRVCVSR